MNGNDGKVVFDPLYLVNVFDFGMKYKDGLLWESDVEAGY